MQCPSCQTPADPSQRFCPGCGAALEAQVDPMIGQLLGGKYKVLRLIGEGGMGAVYEGEQPLGTTKRRVAVKTLHPHLSRDPKIKARFEREVGTVAELEHPNTIQVHDFGATPEGILYIVMEYLQGRSLAGELEKQGPMSPERVVNVLQQVCGSLEEAHGRGIVHRDLKPDNVVLVERAGKKDFVKVLDFGIAKRSKEEDNEEQKLTQQGMVLGTPPYMSPEQFTGRPIDSRSDIYSLGVMTYEMLTGLLPFKATTAWEWATQHMTQPPIPIETIPQGARTTEAMRAALRRALAKNPDERFQNVHEYIEAFSGAGVGPAPQQRTEVGPPLDVAAAFGPSPSNPGAPPMMAGMAPGMPPQGYTPAAGNVAFPTPAAIPQAPPRETGGGNRKALLAVAGVIAAVSVVAIAFAVKGGASSKAVVFDNTSSAQAPAPQTSLAPEAINNPAPTDTAGAEVPPLKNTSGPGSATPASAHPATHPSASPATVAPHEAPPSNTTSNSAALAAQQQAAQAAQAAAQQAANNNNAEPPFLQQQPSRPASQYNPQQPGRYDGPECQRARALRAMGRAREAQSSFLTCLAKGGSL